MSSTPRNSALFCLAAVFLVAISARHQVSAQGLTGCALLTPISGEPFSCVNGGTFVDRSPDDFSYCSCPSACEPDYDLQFDCSCTLRFCPEVYRNWQDCNCDCSTHECYNGGTETLACGCICPNPCQRGGVMSTDTCACDCPWVCAYSGQLNSDCSCNCSNECVNGGWLSPDCYCYCPTTCVNGGLRQADCSCTCSNECVNGGTRNDSDCSCSCPNECANGGTRNDSDCSCSCSNTCANGGTLGPDCSCSCPNECVNGGTLGPDCSCSCPNECVNGGVQDPVDCSCWCPRQCVNGGQRNEDCSCSCNNTCANGGLLHAEADCSCECSNECEETTVRDDRNCLCKSAPFCPNVAPGVDVCPVSQGFCLTHYWNGEYRAQARRSLCQWEVPPYWYGCWGRGQPVHNCQPFSTDLAQTSGSVCDATGRCEVLSNNNNNNRSINFSRGAASWTPSCSLWH